MIANLVSRTQLEREDTIFNISKVDSLVHYFEGYPQGDYLKQLCLVMSLWRKLGHFPICFKPFEFLA